MSEGIFMSRIKVKALSVIAAVAMAIPFAGCTGEQEFRLETSGTGRASLTETSASETYVRQEFDNARYPYFAMLTETEKSAYSQIYEELSEGRSEIECRVNINSDQLKTAIDSMLNDHPELFWLDNNYGYTYDPVTGSVKEITFSFLDFADTPEKLERARADFNNSANAIMAEALTKATPAERELYIHDFICENTTFDSTAPYNQSAYSVLVLHRSVCAGYARAFQHLMMKVGLTCYYVTGRAEGIDGTPVEGSNDDGSHSWNMVLLDGNYYNVDCLWDDTASETYGEPIYPFFNITDEALVHHVRIDMAVGLPVCTASDCKYSNLFGPTIEAGDISFTDAG